MARSALLDPLDKFRWIVEIEGFTRNGFTKCSTPEYRVQERKYSEGGNHLNPLSIVNSIDYSPVTLERGVTNDTSFAKWASGAFDLVQNNQALSSSSSGELINNDGAFPTFNAEVFAETVGNIISPSVVPSYTPSGSSDYPFSYRRDVRIKHINRLGQTEVLYTLYRAYPIVYKPASNFDAEDDNGMSVELLVLAYEGFDVKYSGLPGLLGNLGASIKI